jgi:hypothetical protein
MEDKLYWRKTTMRENYPTVQTHGALGAIDPVTIQGFLDEYRKLETSVLSGEAGPVEQVVYWTTQLTLQSAQDADELRKMLQQLGGIGQMVYVTYHFPSHTAITSSMQSSFMACLWTRLPSARSRELSHETENPVFLHNECIACRRSLTP